MVTRPLSGLVAGVVGAACAVLVGAGCSSSSSPTGAAPPEDSGSTTVDSGSDATTEAGPDTGGGGTEAGREGGDAMTTADAPSEGGPQVIDAGPFMCGNTMCAQGTECCVVQSDAGLGLQCLASCPDGGAPVTCDSPEQCPSNAPICCGSLAISGSGTSCQLGNVSSSCTTSCSTNVSVTPLGPANDTVQFCAQKADCTNSAYPDCCTLSFSGQSETFCLSSELASAAQQFLGATCLQ